MTCSKLSRAAQRQHSPPSCMGWIGPCCGSVACGVSFQSCPRFCCHGSYPAAALGRHSPWRMKLQCLDLAAYMPGVLSAVCNRKPPTGTASTLARFHLPAWSSVPSWLLRLWTNSGFAPARPPAPDTVLHVSAPVHRGAVADSRIGLA